MRAIETIVIHGAYTPVDMDIGAAEIRQWHHGRGWRDIGYHYVIRRDGTIEKGRNEEIAGAHVAGHNGASIGVCLVGGKGDSRTDCNYTRQQWAALESLVTSLVGRYPGAEIKGHREYTSLKDCPGFDARAWWNEPCED